MSEKVTAMIEEIKERIIHSRSYKSECKLCRKFFDCEKLKYECGRPHYNHFVKCKQEHLIAHLSLVQADIIAYHCVHHNKSHNQCENNVLKFCLWHKFLPSFLKFTQKNNTSVLFVIIVKHNVSFPIIYQSIIKLRGLF